MVARSSAALARRLPCTNLLTREWEVDTGLWLTFHEEGCLALKPSEVVSGIARSSM